MFNSIAIGFFTILFGLWTLFWAFQLYQVLDNRGLVKLFLYSIIFIVICYYVGNFVKNIL